jgi:serine phosphatase RsbU (regulator of sigma subunit)
VREVVNVIPSPVKAVMAALSALLLMTAVRAMLVTLRARTLRRQRRVLVKEVGLLQEALLPEVPERIGPVAATVAYRPAEGPGAGGDFYDVFELDEWRVGIVLGDVAGHGHEALARTALLRYTLRAYLETGLEPRRALQVAGRALEHALDSGFATAVAAVYDATTSILTYACAGHPQPIVLAPDVLQPITACSAPPIGLGQETGLRQTSLPLPSGSVVCFFTDGLSEARFDGRLVGRWRLATMLAELGPEPTAARLIERIRREGTRVPDDMAACVIRPLEAGGTPTARIEELELGEKGERHLHRFLAACGVSADEIPTLSGAAEQRARGYGGAVVRVQLGGEHPDVSIVLPAAELIEAASRRQLAQRT